MTDMMMMMTNSISGEQTLSYCTRNTVTEENRDSRDAGSSPKEGGKVCGGGGGGLGIPIIPTKDAGN